MLTRCLEYSETSGRSDSSNRTRSTTDHMSHPTNCTGPRCFSPLTTVLLTYVYTHTHTHMPFVFASFESRDGSEAVVGHDAPCSRRARETNKQKRSGSSAREAEGDEGFLRIFLRRFYGSIGMAHVKEQCCCDAWSERNREGNAFDTADVGHSAMQTHTCLTPIGERRDFDVHGTERERERERNRCVPSTMADQQLEVQLQCAIDANRK
jgi:hypothetical protein